VVAGLKAGTILAGLALVACASGGDDVAQQAAVESCKELPGDRVTLQPSAAGKRYFPESFGEPSQICRWRQAHCIPRVSETEDGWYSRIWDAAEEPSLHEVSSQLAPGHSSIRFTWLPTFDHPVIVRLIRNGRAVTLEARMLSGQGGYGAGEVSRSISRALTSVEIQRLEAVLASTSVLEQAPTLCDIGLDGSQWIVEGADEQGYRFINRWSPNEGPVREFGMVMLDLTGWQFAEIY
jgi:hypothetical protein